MLMSRARFPRAAHGAWIEKSGAAARMELSNKK
jgi:hypothetical protein